MIREWIRLIVIGHCIGIAGADWLDAGSDNAKQDRGLSILARIMGDRIMVQRPNLLL